jgi:hypothetical protein
MDPVHSATNEGRARRVLVTLVGAGLLTAALGVTPAGAHTRHTAGTEDLCPATMPLTQSEYKQQASLLRSYLGCRTSDDPGPSDPGKR